MGMSIDDSERYLRLMLGGMKHAVRYWENIDKEESDIAQTDVETVKTALDTMRKYQKIKEQVDIAIDKENFAISGARLIQIREIINGNDD